MFIRRLLPLCICVLAGVAFVSGCDRDGFGIVDARLDATYVLEAVNGEAQLPVTTYQAEGEQFILLADTLDFHADGSVSRTQVIRVVTGPPWEASDSISRYVSRRRYRIERRQLEIGFAEPCPDNAMCIGPDLGTISASSIWLLAQFPGQPKLQYGRLR